MSSHVKTETVGHIQAVANATIKELSDGKYSDYTIDITSRSVVKRPDSNVQVVVTMTVVSLPVLALNEHLENR